MSSSLPPNTPPPRGSRRKILAVDIGGSKVKVLASGQAEARTIRSGGRLTPARLVEAVREVTSDWEYDALSIGYPGLVGERGPCSEPGYLGAGWVGFDFAAAFGRPVRIINDAAMQALGSYDGGRMLFIGLGTGVGSALIMENVLVTLELGSMSCGNGTLRQVLSQRGLERLGRKRWRAAIYRIAPTLTAAFKADYLVLGGGNAEKLDARRLPAGVRLGNNLTAFRGGFRLWRIDDVRTLGAGHAPADDEQQAAEWRVF